MNNPVRFSLLPCLCLALSLAPLVADAASVAERQNEIRAMRQDVLGLLYERAPHTRKSIREAEGYAVFDNVGVNLVLASFAGGRGVVVDRSGNETFMKMGSAGVGIGLGIKDFRAVFVFRSAKRLQDFIEKGWDLGGQVDAVAKSDEKGAQAGGAVTVIDGIEVYQITKNGIALQATIQGTKYWKDRDLND